MLQVPDKRITLARLATEFTAAGLPRLRGVLRSNRKIDADSNVVLDAAGKPKIIPKYTILKCDLSPVQEQLARDIVAAHTADPEASKAELADQQKDKQIDQPVIKAMISTFSALTNNDEAAVREAIKAQL